MFKKVLSILFLIIVIYNITAQELAYKNYTINDGLLSSNINTIIQDNEGYIWIGTNYGVSKFDGYKFTNYTVSNGLLYNNIIDIFQDKDGRIWFLSSTFYVTYIENDIIHEYKYNNNIQKELYNNSKYLINSFSIENGKLKFAIKDRGLFIVYKNGNIKIFFKNELNNKQSVLVTNKDKLYLLRSGLGNDTLLFFNNCEFTKSPYVIPVISKSTDNIIVERKDKFFYIAKNNTIITLKNKIIIDSINLEDNINYFKILGSNLWVATENSGVIIYSINKKGKLILKNPILYKVKINAIIIDREGGYWLASKNKGLVYIPELDVYEYKLIDNNSNEIITDIISYKNSIYVGTTKGKLLDITNNKTYVIANKVKNGEIKLTKTDYRLIISYNNNLYELTEHNIINNIFNVSELDIENFRIKTIEAKYNKILLSSNVGFVMLVDDYVKKIVTPDKKFKLSINKTFMLQDKTTLIASENGLFRYSDQNFFNYGHKNQILNISINDIYTDAEIKRIFVATSGYGLLCINSDTIIKYSNKGLSSDIISSICAKDSLMVVSSNRGIDLVSFDKDMNINIIQKYNKQYGLLSDEIKKVICGNDTCIYAMSDKGINRIEVNRLQEESVPPYIYIKKININDIDTIKYKDCKLKHNQNYISFEFIGITYKNAGNIKYKYKLIGSKSDWVISKSTKAEYPFLSKGKYKFIVYASNEDGKWSKIPDSFEFEILPPYWETWWFISLLIFSILLIIITTVLLIIRDVKRKEKLKKDLYMYRQQALRKQMNPHFIFNALNSIQHYILQNDKRMSNKYLNKFSSLMRIVLENSQNNLITIERELSALKLYLDIESIRFKDKFFYTLNVDENIDEGMLKIPPLLLQPYAENAIWHGLMNLEKEEIGKLSINIKLINNLLHCIIQDNGVGREKAKELTSNKNKSYQSLGTEINKNRVESFNYTGDSNVSIRYIDLKDEKGFCIGTKVIIILPIIY